MELYFKEIKHLLSPERMHIRPFAPHGGGGGSIGVIEQNIYLSVF